MNHPIAPLEWGEHEFGKELRRIPSPERDALLDALEEAIRTGAPPPNEAFAALLSDPHALGWVHQMRTESRRRASFAAHHNHQVTHADAIATTQVFTPRWVADILAHRCFEISGVAEAFDPACGAGQMLLAWVDVLVAHGVDPHEAFLAVRGVDLDPSVVDVCRDTLRCHARKLGVLDADLERALRERIAVGDGLGSELAQADVVLSNPPYMGRRSMPQAIRAAVDGFAPYQHDLFAAFIAQCGRLATRAFGVLAQQSFWYVAQYEAARRDFLARYGLDLFVHLGSGVFYNLTGEKASVAAFVATPDPRDTVEVVDLREGNAAAKCAAWRATASQALRLSQVFEIPGAPLAHWLSADHVGFFAAFPRVGDYFEIPAQNKTASNAQYVRSMADVSVDDLLPGEFWAPDDWPVFEAWLKEAHWGTSELPFHQRRWALYSKGGPAAPWWGNWHHVVDLSASARQHYAGHKTANLAPRAAIGRPGICYTDFGGRRFTARRFPRGAVADMTGPAIFSRQDDPTALNVLMAVLNSSTARTLLNALNPTLHYQVRDVRNLPCPPVETLAHLSADVDVLVGLTQRLLARDPTSFEARLGIQPSNDLATFARLQHRMEEAVARAYGVPPGLPVPHVGVGRA